MNETCNKCRIIYKGNEIIFICPYKEKEFGLEINKYCRKKLINELVKLKKSPYQAIFTNSKIKKVYSKYIIGRFYAAYKFINSFSNKFLFAKIYKLDKEYIERLINEPFEYINEILYSNNFKRILYKNDFYKEIIDYIDMEYDKNLAYMRLFECDIDYDERWFANVELAEEITSTDSFTVKIFRMPRGFFYYVKLEEGSLCEEDSPLKVLERMDGESRSLRRMIAIMKDKSIQEIYLDKENSWVYLDHEKYGRCDSNVYIKSTDVEKFKTFLATISGEEISTGIPSVKVSLIENEVKMRIAVDVYPIVENTSINIRKFRKKLLTLGELVEKESIELNLAAFLVLCARARSSIVICGEPNSGKTTLAHAIMRYLPKAYRKVYLEDVDEVYSSLDEPHGLFIKTSSIDVSSKYSKKSVEIVKLLHRSPDWIFLGEIQTREHSKAFFHALLAGLKGIVTCHASSAEELIRRWVLQHSIHETSILSLDLIVEMEKRITESSIKRNVRSVYEIRESGLKPQLFAIYQKGKGFDPKSILNLRITDKLISEYRIENIFNEYNKIKEEILNDK